jgi:hypothetical protein
MDLLFLWFFLCLYYFRNNILDYIYDDVEAETNSDKVEIEALKPIVKYEDKYLEEMRKMEKQYQFNEEEIVLLTNLKQKYKDAELNKHRETLSLLQESLKNKLNEIALINRIITEKKNRNGENQVEGDTVATKKTNQQIMKELTDTYAYSLYNVNHNGEDVGDNMINNESLIADIQKEVNSLTKHITALEYKLTDETELAKLDNLLTERAKAEVIDNNLKRLDNCYVFENTPIGNVLMTYDLESRSFKYYSDASMPYRYLEPVGRKFIMQFKCRHIFVDMDDELKLAEERWDKEQNELKLKKEMEEQREKENGNKKKKDVFAKFKTYNKEAGTGRVNISIPPKNSLNMTLPFKKLIETQNNEKKLLKEKANKYSCAGKLANFSFIKKIDRKKIDKLYAMSYAEYKYKRMQMLNSYKETQDTFNNCDLMNNDDADDDDDDKESIVSAISSDTELNTISSKTNESN